MTVATLCTKLIMVRREAKEEEQEEENHVEKNRRRKKCVLYLEKVKKERERINQLRVKINNTLLYFYI